MLNALLQRYCCLRWYWCWRSLCFLACLLVLILVLVLVLVLVVVVDDVVVGCGARKCAACGQLAFAASSLRSAQLNSVLLNSTQLDSTLWFARFDRGWYLCLWQIFHASKRASGVFANYETKFAALLVTRSSSSSRRRSGSSSSSKKSPAVRFSSRSSLLRVPFNQTKQVKQKQQPNIGLRFSVSFSAAVGVVGTSLPLLLLSCELTTRKKRPTAAAAKWAPHKSLT